MMEARASSRKLNSELVAMFPELRQKGFKLAILSNNTTELREKLVAQGIMPLMDEIIISAEVGFQKPHKEVFEVLFNKLNVKPEEVVFIDDSKKSLEKAAEIGYTPIQFKDNEQLKGDLEKLRII